MLEGSATGTHSLWCEESAIPYSIYLRQIFLDNASPPTYQIYLFTHDTFRKWNKQQIRKSLRLDSIFTLKSGSRWLEKKFCLYINLGVKGKWMEKDKQRRNVESSTP